MMNLLCFKGDQSNFFKHCKRIFSCGELIFR